jgi:hypothetical protein
MAQSWRHLVLGEGTVAIFRYGSHDSATASDLCYEQEGGVREVYDGNRAFSFVFRFSSNATHNQEASGSLFRPRIRIPVDSHDDSVSLMYLSAVRRSPDSFNSLVKHVLLLPDQLLGPFPCATDHSTTTLLVVLSS